MLGTYKFQKHLLNAIKIPIIMTALNLWCLTAVLILAARSEVIGNVIFEEQPMNISSYVGMVLIVPCRATTDDPPPRHTVSTDLYLNSAPFDAFYPPSRYGAQTDNSGAIIGFVISGVQPQDNGTQFSCRVVGVTPPQWSTVGTLLVREGTPGAVTGVVQVGPPSLYCATVGWSGAPSSSDNPITLFTVTLSTERGVVLTTADISAEDAPLQSTFCDLQPGTAYRATVIAQNTFGYGDPSPSVAIQTAVPIVLAPPSNIQAVPVNMQDSVTMINISWQPPLVYSDLMTPLVGYVVFYGLDGDHPSNITSTPDVTSSLIGAIRLGVAYVVGVAAVNSAGLSNVTYLPHPLFIPYLNATPMLPSHSADPSISQPSPSGTITIIIVGAVVGCLLFLILIVLLLIACMCYQKRHVGSSLEIQRREGGSPSSIKHFNEVVDLKEVGRSPDLGGRRPPPTSTPSGSDASSVANSSPYLLNNSVANGSPNLNNSKASDSVV